MSDHIFVKTLEEARRIAPNAKLVKDSSGSDIPCHPYAVCLCDGMPGRIVEHDRKAEITRLIRGDYFWLLLGESPEDTEKREKYGLKKGSTRTSPIEVWYSTRVTEDEFRALFGAPKGQAKPMTPEEMRTSPEPNIRMAIDPEPGLAYPQRHMPHIFPTLNRKMESVHTDVPKAGYLKQPTPGDSPSRSFSDIGIFAFNPDAGVIRTKLPLEEWPERPSVAMSGRPLVLRSDDPLAEELKRLPGLGKENTETSAPDVPPVGTPKDRFLDFLQLLKAEQEDPNYLRQSPLPTPEGEDSKNEQRRRFADEFHKGVTGYYMTTGGKGDMSYHSHTAHENTKPTEKPKGLVERMIFSIDSAGGPVQDFMDLPAQPANPLPGSTDPEPEEILAGHVNGELVWNSVFGDVAPSPGQSTPDSKPIEAIHLLSGESFSAASLLAIGMSRSTGALARLSVEGQILERTKWGTGEWGIGIDRGDSAGNQPLVFTVPETEAEVQEPVENTLKGVKEREALKSRGEPDEQS